ncbi:MAG: DUF4340 domain-containing protein [Myxococcales bacterium]|nr:DUF4340 domain-containing protein [Myxococcales bacterium]
MTRRTTIALAIANAALLAFILLYERGTLSTGDLAGRSGQVLRSFVRDRVERVELVRGEDPAIVFVRERDEEAEDSDLELGTWTIAEPLETAADDDAVDNLLSALEWLSAHRRLEEITAADRERFGLDEPRFTVRFRVLEQNVELRIGGDAPTGEGVYAAIEGEPGAYVVGSDIVESLDHDLSHYRDKRVFPDFYPTGVEQVQVDDTRFEREAGVWHLRSPGRGWANQGLVDRLVRITRELQATRFVSEEATDLGRYGLDAPWHDLTITRSEEVTDHRVAHLRVGSACEEHDGERYAIEGDEGPIVCVRDSDVEALVVDPERTREARLLPVANEHIEAIVVTRGELRVEVRHEDDGWKLRVGPEGSVERSDADDDTVATWLDALRDARATAYAPYEAGAHGVDDPTLRIRIERTNDEPALELAIGEASDEGVWARRGDEEAVIQVDPAVRPQLEVDALRFRARQVFTADAADATRIAISRPSGEERAVRAEGGRWALEAPIETDADHVVVREVARQLATLRAERFVAATPAREHGLSAPFATVRGAFSVEEGDPREVAVVLGATTVGGRFAKLESSEVVFVLSTERVTALTRELVSLDLLTVDPDGLESLRLEPSADAPIELVREGTAWQLAGGGTPNDARTRALMDRLGTLRAIGVQSYGDDLGAVTLRVVATRRPTVEGDRTVTIELGEPTGEGDDAYVPARRAGLGVVYRLRPDTVRSLVDYHP